LAPTASIAEVVTAMNGFYNEFLEKCLRDHLDYAAQQDVNDMEANKASMSKVLPRLF